MDDLIVTAVPDLTGVPLSEIAGMGAVLAQVVPPTPTVRFQSAI